ncbi:MAG: HAMP domain-containing histidine kinase [Thiobacillus sp.]|nr:HAMP domain-containing histidine kinase [Thiobacillus sp.]
MSSLRSKILGAYAISKLTLLGFAVVVFADLHFLNRQIDAGLAVADLRRAALEMRRDEKNLFLYADYQGLAHFANEADEARRLLTEFRPTFVGIVGEGRVRELEQLIDNYAVAVAGYPDLTPAQQARASETIREQGSALYATTREILTRERSKLARATKDARDMLLIALVAVIIIGLGAGWYLLRSVARPLKRLERDLVAIDEGRANELPLPSNDRELRSFVAAFNAMLAHMRAQQAQARRNEKVAALGVLVSGVAHELNNPLSNISTSAQLLLEDDGADAALKRQWLAQIDGETERARRIVRRLLDSVRKPQPKLRKHAVAELVQSSLRLVDTQLPAGVHVCVEAPPELECVVDRERLHQVLINLVKNAADAGAKHISVSAAAARWAPAIEANALIAGDPAAVAAAPQALRLCVQDDGPGIPESVRDQIFNPFFTTRAAGDGTGLGLYLVEEIVAEHAGCIVLISPPAGGSCFSVWLPLQPPPSTGHSA